MITPIILAGGSGSRLWPKSRAKLPKQFLNLTSNHTMLQDTMLRLEGLQLTESLVICNEDHRFLAAEQLRQIPQFKSRILLEPMGKNTAPALTLAALQVIKNDPNATLLVLAADHVISDLENFKQTIHEGALLAEAGKLVTFGIVPHMPHTGYGYIKTGPEVLQGFKVDRFVEKPDLKRAQEYLDTGDYLWNSGMFMFKANRFIDEMAKYSPDILDACEKTLASTHIDLDFIRVNESEFAKCPEDSIDYAVMEKTDDAVVLPLDAGWSDVGSWQSLWEIDNRKDENNNVLIGDVMANNTTGCYANSEGRLISLVGVDDIIVVETKDAVLVAHKNKVQDIKQVVTTLKKEKRSEFETHREVFRPWGSYDSIDSGERYQVKRITVKPGEKLSVQKHHHRAEHWVVVSGTALVTNGEETFSITENESTYIPIGVVHSLENPGKIPLELIEVQSGSYLGEDDIVRLSDRYGRSKDATKHNIEK
jgi:mannose-1-phosphate guanylyltransferase